LISWTVPPAIRRMDASPEAVTRSNSLLPCISDTISSEVPAVFTSTAQPVSSSNDVTQSKFGSVSPRSM